MDQRIKLDLCEIFQSCYASGNIFKLIFYGIGEGINPDIPIAIDFAKVMGGAEIRDSRQRRKAVKAANPIYIQQAIDYLKKQRKK